MPRKNSPKHPKRPLHIAPRTLDMVPTLHMVCREKRRFPTEKQAQYAAETQELQQPDLALGVYHCPQCRGWHLTRQQ